MPERKITRRDLLRGLALSPLGLSAGFSSRSAGEIAGRGRPGYTLSANIETLFPDEVPRAERIEQVKGLGMEAFSFWAVTEEDEKAMLAAQQRTGLACGSIAGSGWVGATTGLTKPGYEQKYLDVITKNCKVAERFGAPNLVIFVGKVQEDVPWEKQYQQIVVGLRKAGDIAKEYGCYLCLEPLNRVEHPGISVLSAKRGFEIISEVNHPHVKLDFDIYHLQLSEGNLTNNLKLGLREGWIQFVEIGDVPGRNEPGTGEINYAHIFDVLQEAGYDGYVGMEHGASSTLKRAVEVVNNVADVE